MGAYTSHVEIKYHKFPFPSFFGKWVIFPIGVDSIRGETEWNVEEEIIQKAFEKVASTRLFPGVWEHVSKHEGKIGGRNSYFQVGRPDVSRKIIGLPIIVLSNLDPFVLSRLGSLLLILQMKHWLSVLLFGIDMAFHFFLYICKFL